MFVGGGGGKSERASRKRCQPPFVPVFALPHCVCVPDKAAEFGSSASLCHPPPPPPFFVLFTPSALLDGVKCHGLELSALVQALQNSSPWSNMFLCGRTVLPSKAVLLLIFFPPSSPSSLSHNKPLVLSSANAASW